MHKQVEWMQDSLDAKGSGGTSGNRLLVLRVVQLGMERKWKKQKYFEGLKITFFDNLDIKTEKEEINVIPSS